MHLYSTKSRYAAYVDKEPGFELDLQAESWPQISVAACTVPFKMASTRVVETATFCQGHAR